MKPTMTHSSKEEFYLRFPYTSPYVSLTRYHSQNNDNLEKKKLGITLASNILMIHSETLFCTAQTNLYTCFY